MHAQHRCSLTCYSDAKTQAAVPGTTAVKAGTIGLLRLCSGTQPPPPPFLRLLSGDWRAGLSALHSQSARDWSEVPGADVGGDDIGMEDAGAAAALVPLSEFVPLLRSRPQLPLQLHQLPTRRKLPGSAPLCAHGPRPSEAELS